MASPSHEEGLVYRYLLDELPDAERAPVEERCFADDRFFVFVNACEEELIRDYLRGRLAAADRQRFERKYLTSAALRERVEFSHALMAVCAQSLPAEASARTELWSERLRLWLRAHRWGLPVAVAAASLAIGIAIWDAAQVRRIEKELDSARQGNRALQRQIDAAAAPPAFVSLALLPGQSRGGQTQVTQIQIPAGAAEVRMQLEVGPGSRPARYRAAITAGADRRVEIWSGLVDAAAARPVEIRVPAQLLQPGDYVLTLDSQPSGSSHEYYVFRVVAR